MKDFRVETIAQTEFEEAAVWYESQRSGLGLGFIAEVDRVLVRIAHEESSRRRRSRPCPAAWSGASSWIAAPTRHAWFTISRGSRLREYVLISQRERRLEVYRRDGRRWLLEEYGRATGYR